MSLKFVSARKVIALKTKTECKILSFVMPVRLIYENYSNGNLFDQCREKGASKTVKDGIEVSKGS